MPKIGDLDPEVFREACESSNSIAEVLVKIGWCVSKSNYRSIHRAAAVHDVVLPKWDNRLNGQVLRKINRIPDDEFFAAGTLHSGSHIRTRMIECGVPFVCSNDDCLLHTETTWRGYPVVYQVDHIDGDSTNNVLENLRFLCALCHMQTETFAGKNKRRTDCECGRKKHPETEGCPHGVETRLITDPDGTTREVLPGKCCDCGSKAFRNSVRCQPCDVRHRIVTDRNTYIDWPTLDDLIERIEDRGYLQVSKELGVSDNAIRKRLSRRGIDPLPRKIPKRRRKA